jgi:hypothetical protein
MAHTSSEEAGRAADHARAEARDWAFVADLAEVLTQGEDVVPTELTVTGFDPGDDLRRRAGGWSHTLSDHTLASLARFAAGLAAAEAEAWERDDPSVATRALSDRRFLLGDRIVHWAVPWLVSLGVAEPASGPEAVAVVERLLAIGDRHRPAPALVGSEGLFPPGCDSIGPLPDRLDPTTLANGWLFADPRTELGPEPLAAAAALWTELADAHPGTAQLWKDMGSRARAALGMFEP